MDIFDVFVDMQATGERIRQLRKENHLRVFDLANALGLESEQAIYKWQRGQCLPNADNLVRLSILFGCHIDDILVHNMTGEDESPLLSFGGIMMYLSQVPSWLCDGCSIIPNPQV
jgi:transcriptional regulator with XRE-family HTH domain